jgi:adenylate cyclase
MTSSSAIAEWIVAAGLAGESEGALLGGFCQRTIEAGVPLARGGIIIDTLHPVLEGRAFFWRRERDGGPEMLEYGPTNEGEAAERWRASVFYHLLETGGSQMRLRLSPGEPQQFPLLAGFAEQGLTEYFALLTRFSGDGAIGEMDCVYSHWMTDRPGGFLDEDVALLTALMPSLALAVKCASLTRITETLAETYLGRDPGRRVLAGRIGRGAAEQINAALWFSDLREFTRIAERAEPHHIIPFLNDYAELAIAAIHDHHGDVLKLMGDGVLAVFTAEAPAIACRSAMEAEATLRAELARLNQRRAFGGLPTTEVYLGLHIGEVFYGNIGSKDRLDFTVVGPAVNEVSRIAAMCRSVERELLISEAFADAMTEPERVELVSVGRYALRGVERPQHLFTRDPFAA